jgi:hypothetical protein
MKAAEGTRLKMEEQSTKEKKRIHRQASILLLNDAGGCRI